VAANIGQMNYTRFRFKAVIDWIEIEIYTATSTNFQTVQRRLNDILRLSEGRNAYVKACESGAGGSALVFRFRIYNPSDWQEVIVKLQKLEELIAFSKQPKVTAIEVAFDAYSKGEAKNDELAQLVSSYYRNLTLFVSGNRRLYKGKGSPKYANIRPEFLVKDISEGWQIGIGNDDDDRYQHAYLKTTDDGELLPAEEHRARLEIRLQGEEISHLTFEDWKKYSFQSLSRFFKFRRRKDEKLDPLMQFIAEINPQIGERGKPKIAGKNRLYLRHTEADKVLNQKAFDALRNLSERWKGG
jgi:hypothetical protein